MMLIQGSSAWALLDEGVLERFYEPTLSRAEAVARVHEDYGDVAVVVKHAED